MTFLMTMKLTAQMHTVVSSSRSVRVKSADWDFTCSPTSEVCRPSLS